MRRGFVLGFFVLVFLIGLSSASYFYSGSYNTDAGNYFISNPLGNEYSSYDLSSCVEGQDFILSIDALGCSPSVVRSDLLEENDVPVFCPVNAVKTNPLLDVTDINSITFGLEETDPNVRSVVFYPKRSALAGRDPFSQVGVSEEIGYVVIVLRRNLNETSMPEIIEGSIKAVVNYDLENAFGIRDSTFYLPVMDDDTFNYNYPKYTFFNKRAYLRADAIGDDSATIGIYSGSNVDGLRSYTNDNSDKKRISYFTLKEGQSSGKIYIPGLECYGGVRIQLAGVENPDTFVRFSVGSQSFEVQEGTKFLDDKCQIVKEPYKAGLNERVTLRCNEDFPRGNFELSYSPRVTLNVDGIEKEYSLGERVGENNQNYTYLGYVGSSVVGGKEKPFVYLVSIPISEAESISTLDSKTLEWVARIVEYSSLEKESDYRKGVKAFLKGIQGVSKVTKWFVDGVRPKLVEDDSVDFEGSVYSIVNFSGPINLNMNPEAEGNYSNAIKNYDKVIHSYSYEENWADSNNGSLVILAYKDKINLASSLDQKRDVYDFCKDLSYYYPDAEVPGICYDLKELSSESKSIQELSIDGEVIQLKFEGISEPSLDDFSVEIYVTGGESGPESYLLGKDKTVYLDGSDFISLESLTQTTAKIRFSIKGDQDSKSLNSIETLKDSVSNGFGTKYSFTIEKINLNEVAKVHVLPASMEYARSNTSFNYHIGVEKRLFQLSTEKAESRMEKVNNTIQTLEDINGYLGTVVDTMQKACVLTGVGLTAKNMLFGFKGESIARNAIMNGDGGWEEICAKEVSKEGSDYVSVYDCLLDKSDLIEEDVQDLVEEMDSQNRDFDKIYSDYGEAVFEEGLLEDKIVNSTKLTYVYREEYVLDSLGNVGSSIENPSKEGETISISEIENLLTNYGYEERIYDLESLKEIELYASLYSEDKDNQIYQQKLYDALAKIKGKSTVVEEVQATASRYGTNPRKTLYVSTSEKDRTLVYQGETVGDYRNTVFKNINFNNDFSFSLGDPVQMIRSQEGDFLFVLNKDFVSSADSEAKIITIKKDDEGKLLIWKDGVRVEDELIIPERLRGLSFKFIEGNYNHPIEDAKVQYYETEPYKGLPAIIPFDKDDGWYAHVPQQTPSSVSSNYDESGKIRIFYLCNVGENGKIEGYQIDNCNRINLDDSNTFTFNDLDRQKTISLIQKAQRAIMQARTLRESKSGISEVKILDEVFKVGAPAANSADYQCTDYMSPKDCQILFNVCDPVICANSRCDFGGKYPVTDVIQSGIVGSIALCLPNAQEGIYVPVCLSGIKAGVDNLVSVMKSYEDCLGEQVESGATVGICDEIQSVYFCDLLWREVIPLAKVSLPKLGAILAGQNVRGGGEYLTVASAWKNAQDSIGYITQYYSADSYDKFKSRSSYEIGTSVCKNFISTSYPGGFNLLNMFNQEVDSPVQFSASFQEIPMTSATNPPLSQYKVYFHIYSGKNEPATYQVYLQGSTSSYYQDTVLPRNVDSGYISVDDYASQTLDFIAYSGYEKLCVKVSNSYGVQEECGFGRVSTSFLKDYVQDEYTSSQATVVNITTEEDCLSTKISVYDVFNLNLQQSAESLVGRDVSALGITRTCSTENPGVGTDITRWKKVGVCGTSNLGCWLDTESLNDADIFKFEESYEETIKELELDTIDSLVAAGEGLNHKQFANYIDKIEEENDLYKKLDIIDSIIPKTLYPKEKAYLYYLKGEIYASLARIVYVPEVKEPVISEVRTEEEAGEEGLTKFEQFFGSEDFVSPVFEFRDGSGGTKNICYGYSSEGGWGWHNDCSNIEKGYREGRILGGTYGFASTSSEDLYWFGLEEVEYEKIDLRSKNFFKSLAEKSYFEGVKGLLDEVDVENSGWLDRRLLVGDVRINDEKIFEVEGLEGDTLYLYYDSNKGWLWSLFEYKKGDSNWQSLLDSSTQLKQRSLVGALIPFRSPYQVRDLSEEQRELIQIISGYETELEGALILFSYEDYLEFAGTELGQTEIEVESESILYKSLIEEYSLGEGVPFKEDPISPALVTAVIKQESNFNAYAVSSTGCKGLMQFCSSAAYQYGLCDKEDCSGVDNRLDAEKSIKAGTEYLRDLLKKYSFYEDSEEFALASYNGGSGVVNKAIQNLESEGKEINWNNLKNEIDSDLLKSFSVYSSWDDLQLESKINQIISYVDKVLSYKEDYVGLFESGLAEENFPGIEILSVAESMIGQDTTRIVNGEEVYDYVCATFVSNVLIRAGTLKGFDTCSPDSITYRDAVIELNAMFSRDSNYYELSESEWLDGLKEGDILIWGGSGDNKPEFQHITLFSNYDSNGNFVIIHDGGKNVGIDKKTYSLSAHEEGSWYITHVWRFTGVPNSGVSLSDAEKENSVIAGEIWANVFDAQSALDYLEENPSLMQAPDSLYQKQEFIETVFRKGILYKTSGLDSDSEIEDVKDALELKIIEDKIEEVIDVKSALIYLGKNSLEGNYKDSYENELFLKKLNDLKILDDEEYGDALGNKGPFGGLFDSPSTMKEIEILLEIKGETQRESQTTREEEIVGSLDSFPIDWDKIINLIEEDSSLAFFQDEEGISLMHYAVVEDDVSLIFDLVNLGVPINELDSDGNTPLDWAVQSFEDVSDEVRDILMENGAKTNGEL